MGPALLQRCVSYSEVFLFYMRDAFFFFGGGAGVFQFEDLFQLHFFFNLFIYYFDSAFKGHCLFVFVADPFHCQHNT